MEELIKSQRFELVEDHHHPGNGRYEVVVIPTEDITEVLPYLNSVLDNTVYDHENKILIGSSNDQRCAFRPYEIRAGIVTDTAEAPRVAQDIVNYINHVWAEHDHIEPSLKERKIPTAYDIFKLLPRKNCQQCGCPTCLAYAAKLRIGEAQLEQCTLLAEPEYAESRKNVKSLFPRQEK